jgi:hypothetical protein
VNQTDEFNRILPNKIKDQIFLVTFYPPHSDAGKFGSVKFAFRADQRICGNECQSFFDRKKEIQPRLSRPARR